MNIASFRASHIPNGTHLAIPVANNDVKNDLHTPLDVGTMPISNLEKAIKALKQKKYDGYYSLELLNLQNPIKTLKENIQILKEIYDRV